MPDLDGITSTHTSRTQQEPGSYLGDGAEPRLLDMIESGSRSALYEVAESRYRTMNRKQLWRLQLIDLINEGSCPERKGLQQSRRSAFRCGSTRKNLLPEKSVGTHRGQRVSLSTLKDPYPAGAQSRATASNICQNLPEHMLANSKALAVHGASYPQSSL